MVEQWKRIPGFDNYEISNTGRIFRLGKTKRTSIKVSRSVNYYYACLASKQINVKQILDSLFDEHVLKDAKLDSLGGEEWHDVVGWEESHEVSNLGRVRTKVRKRLGKNGSEAQVNAKVLNTYLDEDGYERVSLYFDNTTKLAGVHRLVASAFIPNPEGLPQVNHKNGNKADNRAENLEWVSQVQNIRHSIEFGLRNPQLYCRPVSGLDDNSEFNSVSEFCRAKGLEYRETARRLKEGQIVTVDTNRYTSKKEKSN